MARILRLTSLLFLVPAAVAPPPLAALLAANTAVSVAVHSFDRPERTLLDTADNLLVMLWALANAYMLRGAKYAVAAIMCAATVAVLAACRLQWPKGATRTALHGAMHATGALGTLLLLL